jgi:hypothetical protein
MKKFIAKAILTIGRAFNTAFSHDATPFLVLVSVPLVMSSGALATADKASISLGTWFINWCIYFGIYMAGIAAICIVGYLIYKAICGISYVCQCLTRWAQKQRDDSDQFTR